MDENITKLIMMTVYVFVFVAAVNASRFFLSGVDKYANNIYEFMDKHGGSELNQISNVGENIIEDHFYFDGATVISYMANFGYFTNKTSFDNVLAGNTVAENYNSGIKYITNKKVNVLDVAVLVCSSGSSVVTSENQIKVNDKYEMFFLGQNRNGVKCVKFVKVT